MENPEVVKRVRRELDQGKERWGRKDISALLDMLDIYELDATAVREIEAEWAEELRTLAYGLPGYVTPEHDPSCPSCIITRAIQALREEKKK